MRIAMMQGLADDHMVAVKWSVVGMLLDPTCFGGVGGPCSKAPCLPDLEMAPTLPSARLSPLLPLAFLGSTRSLARALIVNSLKTSGIFSVWRAQA